MDRYKYMTFSSFLHHLVSESINSRNAHGNENSRKCLLITYESLKLTLNCATQPANCWIVLFSYNGMLLYKLSFVFLFLISELNALIDL